MFGDQLDESRGADWWRTLAMMPRVDFVREAETLLGTLAALRKAAAAADES